jgi:hypothetical protein
MSAQANECWCCGAATTPTTEVRLGNHPEVALCLPCARWVAKRAGEVEDRGRSGPGVRARSIARRGREYVVRHGWHRHPLVGRSLRRLGRYLP